MARYTRMQISDLCKQIEDDASTLLTVRPAISGRMKTMVMLLRLTTQLADIKEIETTPNVVTVHLVPKH
jgi:hypothetical protein